MDSQGAEYEKVTKPRARVRGSRRRNPGVFCIVLAALALAAGGHQLSWGDDRLHGETIRLAAGNEPLAQIVISSEATSAVTAAAEALQEQVELRTRAKLPVVSPHDAEPATTSIHIGTAGTDRALADALAALGRSPLSPEDPGREAFQLASGTRDGTGIVVVNGCDDLGTFHGVGWLLRRMRFSEGGVTLPEGVHIIKAPATFMRNIQFGDHFVYVNTEVPQWRKIWVDYMLWGLSTATFRCDPAHQGDPRETDIARYLWDKWTERVRMAKSLGLEVAHITQTNLVFKDGEFGPAEIPDFEELNYMCPDFNGVNPKFPRAIEILKASRKWFFDHMPLIDQVDYFITSGWDGGGCKDPDAAPWSVTYAELVDTIIHPLIAEHNPDAKIILRVYWVPDVEPLAEKLHEWRPDWLYAVEMAAGQRGLAPLFPKDMRLSFFPLAMTMNDSCLCADSGANPYPKGFSAGFRRAWYDSGFQGRCGTQGYSEGTHDHINHVILMQLGWDPDRPVDDILDEYCRYYFGEKAAGKVKEAIYLMEDDYINHIYADPTQKDMKLSPRVTELVNEAEKLLPRWARRSRYWAIIKGRGEMNRTRIRQLELMSQWDEHWQRYQSLAQADVTSEAPEWLVETKGYFRAVVANGQDMNHVILEMDRRGYNEIQGNPIPVWPDVRTGDAAEASEALETWRPKQGLGVPGRWCVAFLSATGDVAVGDGWGNYVSSGTRAADARMVIADPTSAGANSVIFLGVDGNIASWSPLGGVAVLAEGDFLTGPLAAGDLDGDGRDELVALVGTSLNDARLGIVKAGRDVKLLGITPSGSAPEVAAKGVVLAEPRPSRTVQIDRDPHVVVCDADGDGRLEIVCGDRNRNDQLVILDSSGRRVAAGPPAPAGALAAGDLDGDDCSEVVFLNTDGELAAYSTTTGVLRFAEPVKPRWPSAVAVAPLGVSPGQVVVEATETPGVVYADAEGYPRVVYLEGNSQRLSEWSSSVAVGPGMVAGDFNNDGRYEVCYLRRWLSFVYPLADFCYVDRTGNLRGLPHNITKRALFCAPLGPRASGRLRFR